MHEAATKASIWWSSLLRTGAVLRTWCSASISWLRCRTCKRMSRILGRVDVDSAGGMTVASTWFGMFGCWFSRWYDCCLLLVWYVCSVRGRWLSWRYGCGFMMWYVCSVTFKKEHFVPLKICDHSNTNQVVRCRSSFFFSCYRHQYCCYYSLLGKYCAFSMNDISRFNISN